jgi:hypothetical protein
MGNLACTREEANIQKGCMCSFRNVKENAFKENKGKCARERMMIAFEW